MTLYTARQLSVPDAAACAGLIYSRYISIDIYTHSICKVLPVACSGHISPIYTVACDRLAISIEKRDMLCVQGSSFNIIFKQDAQLYDVSKNNTEVLISETDFAESLISRTGAVGTAGIPPKTSLDFCDDSLSVNVNTNRLLLSGRAGPAQQLLAALRARSYRTAP